MVTEYGGHGIGAAAVRPPNALRHALGEYRTRHSGAVVEPTAPASAVPAARGVREVRARWFAMVTAGEFLGFLVPALAGALIAHASGAAVAAVMLTAGAVEGAVLGYFQARVLRTLLSCLRIREWMAVTSAGAVVAWSIGVLPMLYGERFGAWPTWAQVPVAVAGSVIVVSSIGVAQWTVLRRFSDRSALWILANAVAWIGGLIAFTVVAPPLWQPGQPLILTAAIGALGGAAMAAAMAWVTGAFLTQVLADGHRRTPPTERRS
ncbi:hypothetical protein [Nocardia sp. NPDC059239]|uniref:hypothetical protein n=1 Tax=unclassified Nocardia TaxID=2637762 RepID=UPI0036CD4DC8